MAKIIIYYLIIILYYLIFLIKYTYYNNIVYNIIINIAY